MADHNLIAPISLFMPSILLSIAIVTGPAAGTVVGFDQPGLTLLPGEIATVNLTLDQAPAGTSGYKVTISSEDPQVGEISGVTLPSWAELSAITGAPGPDVRIKAVDLRGVVKGDASNLVLATLSVKGLSIGTTKVVLSDPNFYDRDGNEIATTLSSLSLMVATGETSIPATILPVTSVTGNAPPDIYQVPATVTTEATGPGSSGSTVSLPEETATEPSAMTAIPAISLTPALETTKPGSGRQEISFITAPGILLTIGALILLGNKMK